MAGATITPSELPGFVAETGYPVLAEAYDRQPTYYPLMSTVQGVTGLTADFQGHRQLVNPGMQRHVPMEIGEEISAGNAFEGYTVYTKIKKYGRRMEIPKEMVASGNGRSEIGNLIAKSSADWGELAPVIKDEFFAGVLQKGTLTAGSSLYFDGSFVGNADPNTTVIFNGLPFFDTAHTITGPTTTFANHTASRTLTQANLDATLTTMRVTNAKDERGERIINNPDLLVVPVDLEGTARRIIESELVPENALNGINHLRGRLAVVASPYLTDDSDAWWVGHSTRGLQCFDSGMPVLETEYDARTQCWIVTSTFYFGVGVRDWRPWYCCNKAAS